MGHIFLELGRVVDNHLIRSTRDSCLAIYLPLPHISHRHIDMKSSVGVFHRIAVEVAVDIHLANGVLRVLVDPINYYFHGFQF